MGLQGFEVVTLFCFFCAGAVFFVPMLDFLLVHE